jgi:hypothetical protein
MNKHIFFKKKRYIIKMMQLTFLISCSLCDCLMSSISAGLKSERLPRPTGDRVPGVGELRGVEGEEAL